MCHHTEPLASKINEKIDDGWLVPITSALGRQRARRINRGHLPLSNNFKDSLNRSYLKDKTKPNKRQTQNLSVTFLSQTQKSESNPEETPGNSSDGSLKHKGQEKIIVPE